MPHRGRVSPSQDDTIRDLEFVLTKKVPQGDCICIMGDLNEQLEGNIRDRTGRWVAGPKSPNSSKLITLMQLHQLTAMNTMFDPGNKFALNTFLQTKRSDQQPHNDFGEHVGAEVKAKYRGRWIKGKVVSSRFNRSRKWLVKFDDGHIKNYNRAGLEKVLTRTKRTKVGRQLDYVLVSTRWKSSITSCKAKWAPSIRRSIHGEKSDHALVECVWRWRLRVVKKQIPKDYRCLYEKTLDENGNEIIENGSYWAQNLPE